nr:ImmA/IrrE family metallo-endopeptidase [Fodinibius salsisoli]
MFDFIEKQDVQLKFTDISSLEGIYSKEPGPLILLNSLRPHGRQYFNCAHEYGHHVFEHGIELDEIIDSNSHFDPEEFLVDTFAGFLLMPKSAIRRAFNIRNIRFDEFNPVEFYKIASNIGVGYQTILFHLFRSLRLIEKSLYKKLSSVKVQEIKKEILGQSFPGELIYVDENWEGRPIDIQVNDILAIEGSYKIECNNVKRIDEVNGISIYKGVNTGIGRIRLQMQDKVHFLRVSRHQYVGINKYKHLETEI